MCACHRMKMAAVVLPGCHSRMQETRLHIVATKILSPAPNNCPCHLLQCAQKPLPGAHLLAGQ